MENQIALVMRVWSSQRRHALILRRSTRQERIYQLKKLKKWILDNQELIRTQIHADFGKPYPEIDLSEIYAVTSQINFTIKNLADWMKPKRVPTPTPMLGSDSYICFEPKGTSLILAPWNYPFNLALGPLVSALAAGCTAIIKPSEHTPSTSTLLVKLVNEVFNPEHVAVVEGDAAVASHLLSLPFDHIFFTGSPAVGKLVMQAAAQNLSSVTLELGGKSPAIIEDSADLNDAASKIAYGKFINSGQTCIAPDYVLVQESLRDAFVLQLARHIDSMYPTEREIRQASPDLARIVNSRHFERLQDLVQDALVQGASISHGGRMDLENCFIEPCIMTNITPEMKLMQEEIFGPILPIVTYKNLDDAIDLINSMPKPLAIYAFTKNKQAESRIKNETSSGGLVINDCVLHFLQHELPFGGVNNSGIGKAHGYYGFLAFTNEKAIMKQRIGLTSLKPIYPPYGKLGKNIIASLVKWF
jgi:aldehyde dehydrogenase (NAD+)